MHPSDESLDSNSAKLQDDTRDVVGRARACANLTESEALAAAQAEAKSVRRKP